MTKEEVRARIGVPSRIVGPECWQYKESRAWDAQFRDFCFKGADRVVEIRRQLHG